MPHTLLLTALLMGLVGGPHCIAMCGAACAGIGRVAGSGPTIGIAQFQVGRVIGYAGLGALAAGSMQGLGWLTVQSAALRPLWSIFHVAAALLGLVLVWQARQPLWLEGLGRKVWQRATRLTRHGPVGTPVLIGMVWALLPCGLLYSAVLVAAMAGSAAAGASVMALFALGTSVTMGVAPWIWLRWYGTSKAGHANFQGTWGVRIAGIALASSSAWALWMGLAHGVAPWCTVNS